jgi:hypothetical protein
LRILQLGNMSSHCPLDRVELKSSVTLITRYLQQIHTEAIIYSNGWSDCKYVVFSWKAADHVRGRCFMKCRTAGRLLGYDRVPALRAIDAESVSDRTSELFDQPPWLFLSWKSSMIVHLRSQYLDRTRAALTYVVKRQHFGCVCLLDESKHHQNIPDSVPQFHPAVTDSQLHDPKSIQWVGSFRISINSEIALSKVNL